MAGHKVTVRKGTILEAEIRTMASLAGELRAGGRAVRVAAEIAKPGPERFMGPMERLAEAAAGRGAPIPLLDGDALAPHMRRMRLETMLINHMMRGGTDIRKYAERHIIRLRRDLEGMPYADNEVLPLVALLNEGCFDNGDKALKAAKEAKLRVEAAMTGIIASQTPELVLVHDYLADATIEGYTNLEL